MVRYLLVFAGVVALGVLAVNANWEQTAESDAISYGQFEGEVIAAWNEDGRNMTLREDFAYIDSQNRRWLAPAGSQVNGASIPAAFWTFIGGPFEGKYRNASVIHDVGCIEMSQSWQDVHRMFYEACRCGGVDEANAKTLYYAVYHFGPRWEPVTETVVELHQTPDGRVVEQEVTVQHMVRMDPPPPTAEELEKVEAFVAEENPEPEAIQELNRNELRSIGDFGQRRSRSWNRDPRTDPRESEQAPQQQSDAAAESGEAPPAQRPMNPHPSRGFAGPHAGYRGQWNLPPVSAEEQEQAIDAVDRHITGQTGEARPAQYTVERVRGGYLVNVRFLQQDEAGMFLPAEGHATVRLSRQGEVVEFVSGN